MLLNNLLEQPSTPKNNLTNDEFISANPFLSRLHHSHLSEQHESEQATTTRGKWDMSAESIIPTIAIKMNYTRKPSPVLFCSQINDTFHHCKWKISMLIAPRAPPVSTTIISDSCLRSTNAENFRWALSAAFTSRPPSSVTTMLCCRGVLFALGWSINDDYWICFVSPNSTRTTNKKNISPTFTQHRYARSIHFSPSVRRFSQM